MKIISCKLLISKFSNINIDFIIGFAEASEFFGSLAGFLRF